MKPRNFDHFEERFFIENPEISEITDSRIHGCVAHRSEGDKRGFAGVCGGLRGFARPEAQQPGSKLKAQDNPRILESSNSSKRGGHRERKGEGYREDGVGAQRKGGNQNPWMERGVGMMEREEGTELGLVELS